MPGQLKQLALERAAAAARTKRQDKKRGAKRPWSIDREGLGKRHAHQHKTKPAPERGG